MIGIVTMVAVLAVTAVGIGLAVTRPASANRLLRWAAFGLTVAIAAVLTPYTVSDSGAAAVFLLGVPVLATAIPVVADLVSRGETVADVVGGSVLVVWGLLLGLGLGGAFLPAALLLFAAFAMDLVPRQSHPA